MVADFFGVSLTTLSQPSTSLQEIPQLRIIRFKFVSPFQGLLAFGADAALTRYVAGSPFYGHPFCLLVFAGLLQVREPVNELFSERPGGRLRYDYDEFLSFSISFDLDNACESTAYDLCIGFEPRFAFVATRVNWNLGVEEQRGVAYRFVCPSENGGESVVWVKSLFLSSSEMRASLRY